MKPPATAAQTVRNGANEYQLSAGKDCIYGRGSHPRAGALHV